MLYHVPDCFDGFARQVDGETRVGVFASRSVKVGDPLTYDYRYFNQIFCSIALMKGHAFLIKKANIYFLALHI